MGAANFVVHERGLRGMSTTQWNREANLTLCKWIYGEAQRHAIIDVLGTAFRVSCQFRLSPREGGICWCGA